MLNVLMCYSPNSTNTQSISFVTADLRPYIGFNGLVFSVITLLFSFLVLFLLMVEKLLEARGEVRFKSKFICALYDGHGACVGWK